MSHNVVILSLEGLEPTPGASRSERVLAGVRGVRRASLNLQTGRVRVAYDPEIVHLRGLVEAVRSSGCDVRASHAVIGVDNLGCPSCAARVEAALCGVEGVLHAAVDLPARRAIVSYLPGHLTHRDLGQAIRAAGYQPTGTVSAEAAGGRLVDAG